MRPAFIVAAAAAAWLGKGAAAVWAADAGEGEPPIEAAGAEGTFLRALHARVHTRWSDNFLKMAAAQLPKTHALNDAGLRAVVEVTLERNGALVELAVKERSGAADFDAAAADVLKDSLPMPGAPEEMLSDDDRLHLTWAFARDHRRCGEVKAFQKESPLEEALPRLMAKKREAEALRRVKAAAATAPDPALSLFATAWLKSALADPRLARTAAFALLAAGDTTGEKLVREAIQQGEVGGGAAVLARAKLPVCELVKDNLGKDGSREQAAAVEALRAGAEAACAPALLKVAQSRKLPAVVRAGAIEALGAGADAAARQALVELEKDGPTAVRAAALLAAAQPGGGRSTLLHLTPGLRDPALEVRVAAITGILRAGGDGGLDQLYLLFKETDPRPYEAAAAGLARLSSEKSAGALGRMLRKEDKRIRVAAAAALASRSDGFARTALEAARKDAAIGVVVFASALMSDAERREVVARLAGDPDAPRLYRALVAGSGRRAAAEWLLGKMPQLTPAAKLDLLGAWMAGGASEATAAR
jgi:HEAT repeat protein